jgi:hypothetical protein
MFTNTLSVRCILHDGSSKYDSEHFEIRVHLTINFVFYLEEKLRVM